MLRRCSATPPADDDDDDVAAVLEVVVGPFEPVESLIACLFDDDEVVESLVSIVSILLVDIFGDDDFAFEL